MWKVCVLCNLYLVFECAVTLKTAWSQVCLVEVPVGLKVLSGGAGVRHSVSPS